MKRQGYQALFYNEEEKNAPYVIFSGCSKAYKVILKVMLLIACDLLVIYTNHALSYIQGIVEGSV